MDAKYTDTGLQVGPMEVTVLFTDDRHGACVRLKTGENRYVDVYTSPKGRSLRTYAYGVKQERYDD